MSVDLRNRIVQLINDLPYDERYEDLMLEQFDKHLRKVEHEIVDQDRWSILIRDVWSVALNDETTDVQYFEVLYSEGSTEYQEDHPEDAVANAVTPKTVLVTQYVRD